MRIPNNLTDELSATLNRIYADASKLYLGAISERVRGQKVDIMLGDASVTQHQTFEPQRVAEFFEQIRGRSRHWPSPQGVEKTNTDDLRRLHMQLVAQVDNKYELSCYLAIQYHALYFYRCDKEVIEIKKELFGLDERIASLKPNMESKQNLLLEQELRKRGMSDLNFEDLMTAIYNDEKLRSDLEEKVREIEESNSEYYQAIEQRKRLLERLNGMLIELYSVKPVLLDQNGLLQGEEGAALHFDLQAVGRDGSRSGYIPTGKVPEGTGKAITDRLREIEETLRAIGG